jgi:hypothetical protein
VRNIFKIKKEKRMEDKIFSEKIEEFKKIQCQQKQNGLNDYNMTNIVRKASEEVGMHSNIIYSLINPDGLHYREDLFLNLFMEYVIRKGEKDKRKINNKEIISYKNTEISSYDFGKELKVKKEEYTKEKKRIDFTIKSDTYFIGIEMKVHTVDSKKQIYDYWIDLKAKAKEDKNQTVIMFYLTKNGKEARNISISKSGEELDSKNIKDDEEYVENLYNVSFKEHIISWLDACQKEVKNIANLNMELENYKNIVSKAVNKANFKKNVLTLDRFILEDKNSSELLKTLFNFDYTKYNNYKKLLADTKAEVMYRFFQSFSPLLDDKMDNMNHIIKNDFNETKLIYTKQFCIKHFNKKGCKDFGIFYKIDDDYMFCIILGENNLHLGIVGYLNKSFIDIKENKDFNEILEARGKGFKLFTKMKKWFSISIDLSKNTDIFLNKHTHLLTDKKENNLKSVLSFLKKIKEYSIPKNS